MLRVTTTSEDPKERELEVDEAIAGFDSYFSSIQPAGAQVQLTRYERAAIKTFVAYMLGLGPNNPAKKEPAHG